MAERMITACIDGSSYAEAACDAAVWAAGKLESPLTFLHVISQRHHAAATDCSGWIGLGTREHLRDELVELDRQRARLAQAQGRDMLDAACQKATAAGLEAPHGVQRNEELIDALKTLEDETRLLILGKRGESGGDDDHLGSNLERVIRGMSCPILLTTPDFQPPERIMIAFDGSETAENLIQRAIATPLFRQGSCHLVFVGSPDDKHQRQLEQAAATLRQAGPEVTTAVIQGEVEPALHEYQRDNDIDLMVMGAYGHSRIRQLLVGSTTTELIRRAEVPVLITR